MIKIYSPLGRERRQASHVSQDRLEGREGRPRSSSAGGPWAAVQCIGCGAKVISKVPACVKAVLDAFRKFSIDSWANVIFKLSHKVLSLSQAFKKRWVI